MADQQILDRLAKMEEELKAAQAALAAGGGGGGGITADSVAQAWDKLKKGDVGPSELTMKKDAAPGQARKVVTDPVTNGVEDLPVPQDVVDSLKHGNTYPSPLPP
ncbi:hypothetical protein JCM8547_007401 [Rhodosporidiobolus lusitaniae]